MQIGAKLIAEAEEDNYDYLNFNFQNILTYQPEKKDSS